MPDPLLPDHSIARRVDRELFLLLGGTAALLMQVAHPLVAAGVERHSDFARDPIGRLRRTLDTTLEVVFAEPAAARAALRRIDRRHGAVRGTAADGRGYDARDPELLLWVQATLVLTSLRLYEAVLGPLAPDDRAAYWSETKPVAELLGIPLDRQPGTLAELEDYERRMIASDARPDATSMRVARRVARPLAWLPDPLYWPSDALAAALIPAPLRASLGLQYRIRERVLVAILIAIVRLLRSMLPHAITVVPQARRWESRARAQAPGPPGTSGAPNSGVAAIAAPADLAGYYRSIAPFYDAEMSIRDDLAEWRGLVARSDPATILDLGCGGGRIARAFAPRRVVGVDLLTELLHAGRGFSFVQGDLRVLPFRDATFDIAVAADDPFAHLLSDEERAKAIGEAMRVARRVVIDGLSLTAADHARASAAGCLRSAVLPGGIVRHETWYAIGGPRYRVTYRYVRGDRIVAEATSDVRAWRTDDPALRGRGAAVFGGLDGRAYDPDARGFVIVIGGSPWS